MHTSPSHLRLSLLLLLLLLSHSAYSSSWEPVNMQAMLKQRMKQIGQVLNCQTFPSLGPLPPKYPPLMDLINSFSTNISKLVQAESTPSLTVNLIYDQDILWTQGYGLKNLSDPSSVPDGDTNYMIGSNTKLFTTLLALIAQDKGAIAFTDEVAAHVPDFAPSNPFPSLRGISFNQLASHMAGLPRESPCEAMNSNCNFNNGEMWERFKNVTLVNPPGLIPQYSNAGFACLGHIIEEIMENEWGDLVQNEILGPLQMNSSGTNCSNANFMAERAIGYTTNNVEAPLMQIGWESPAGSMYSTANDMAKFVSFFFRDDVPYMAQPDQILDAVSIREWRTPRYNIDLTGFGMPWEIFQSPIIYTKGGAIAGYLSLTVTVPQLKLGMIILQSSDAKTTFLEVFQMWAVSFINAFAVIMEEVSPAPVIPPSFSKFTGTYLFQNSTITIAIIEAQYPIPALLSQGYTFPLDYFSEFIFKLDTTHSPISCSTQQDGTEQYVIFNPSSSPPSFTIPGMLPGVTALKIA